MRVRMLKSRGGLWTIESMAGLSHRLLKVLLLAVLCVGAYAPAFNNGFIADDFHNLVSATKFRTDPLYLFSIPPQNFRATTFVVFALEESAFGDRSALYYAFPLFMHFLNCLLLWKLILLLGRRSSEAFLAACLFSVFQAPQEAIMWLSASAEVMLAFSVLAMLILWVRERYLLSALMYCVALVNKESAPLAIPLILLMDWYRGRIGVRKEYLLFIPPTLAFGIVFLQVSPNNPMIQAHIYEFGPQAIGVLLRSLHRLIWPWIYILVISNRWISGRWISRSAFMRALAVLIVAMLPYSFLTYDKHLPSRQVYIASIALMAFMAWIIERTPSRIFQQAFIITFILFNICYLWLRKDAQYEKRAAPTTALLKVLDGMPPAPIMILDFAYPYPIIAKCVSHFRPGWTQDMIRVQGADPPCESCAHFRWDPESQTYHRLELQ